MTTIEVLGKTLFVLFSVAIAIVEKLGDYCYGISNVLEKMH